MKIFNEDLEFGQKGEDLFEKEILPRFEEHWEKSEDRNSQNFKGDFIGQKAFYEIKTRKPSYSNFAAKDICIEIKNTNEDKELFSSWLEKYSDNTYLIYQWTEIEKGELKLIYPIIIFKPIELKEHLKWLKRHKLKPSQNQNYKTWCVFIKLEKLEEKINVGRITPNKIIWSKK
jgi:hypothetical protein